MPRRRRNAVDVQIGKRIHRRRTELDISMAALGAAISVSYQKIQKYEQGSNRIAASLLYEIAYQLQMPVTYFYEGLEPRPC